MKAVVLYEHGSVEKLCYEDVPEPKVGPREVLVRVRACALNHIDIWIRERRVQVRVRLPRILGSELSGEVVEVGSGVSAVKVGDRVLTPPVIGCGRCEFCTEGCDNLCPSHRLLGLHLDGGYAEYVKVPEYALFPIPEGLSFEEAASIPLVFTTAWHMLMTKAQLRAGETILVLAAGSGIGSAAVQIAKGGGARVIATASTEAKLAKAKELGADEAINYKEKDFSREVRKLTAGRGVDVVFEHVGSETWRRSLESLAKKGRLVTCGATTGGIGETDIWLLFSRELSIIGSYAGSRRELLEVLKLFERRKLRPVIDRTFPLEKAAEAQKLLKARDHFGKLVLIP